MRLTLFIGFAILLYGCYTKQKATSQFSRAAVAYPELPAGYCATVYPVRDSIIKGKDSLVFDTIYTGGEIEYDTVYSVRLDTVFVTINSIYLPKKTIRERIIRTDTVYKENTAALDLCNIERRNAVLNETRALAESDKWRKIAKKRFWVIMGMGAGIALGVFALIRKRAVSKIYHKYFTREGLVK